LTVVFLAVWTIHGGIYMALRTGFTTALTCPILKCFSTTQTFWHHHLFLYCYL